MEQNLHTCWSLMLLKSQLVVNTHVKKNTYHLNFIDISGWHKQNQVNCFINTLWFAGIHSHFTCITVIVLTFSCCICVYNHWNNIFYNLELFYNNILIISKGFRDLAEFLLKKEYHVFGEGIVYSIATFCSLHAFLYEKQTLNTGMLQLKMFTHCYYCSTITKPHSYVERVKAHH